MSMSPLLFFDSTLRDGSHAVEQKLTLQNIDDYCRDADAVGFHVIIVGHGNGLGASSLQVGLSTHTDDEMLSTAKKHLKKTKLGVFLIPGFGTISNNLKPALDIGVDLVCVASHCTEADVTCQHIGYVRANNKDAYGILMSCHMATAEVLEKEALKMQEYGAMGIILMDSAGTSLPEQVSVKIKRLVQSLKIPVGYHAHNNLGMALYNSIAAVQAGATIMDGTVRGFGAGAGNCQLEVLVALLQMYGIGTPVDLYKIMDLSENIMPTLMKKDMGISPLSLISGMSGVFSAFAPHVKRAAERFHVDSRDIFIELGKRRVVGGQEDMIVDVAMNLAQMAKKDNFNYTLEALL